VLFLRCKPGVMQGSYEYIATDYVARVFITVFFVDPSWVVGTKYFILLMRVSFSYIQCMRPTRPDLPIGYVGLSLVPQDPRGSLANCVTHGVNCRYIISSINICKILCLNPAQVTSKYKHHCCPCPKWADFVYSLMLD